LGLSKIHKIRLPLIFLGMISLLLGNAAAILLFLVNTIVSVRKNLKLSLSFQKEETLPREKSPAGTN